MLKKIFLSLFIILIALLSIALYRTFTHLAYDVDKIEGEIISIDEVKASQNLAASIRFKTISYQDKEKGQICNDMIDTIWKYLSFKDKCFRLKQK